MHEDIELKYPKTNIYPLKGDVVKYTGEDSEMIVEDVVETSMKRESWGIDNNCIMIKSDKYGLITDDLDDDSDIIFIRREEIYLNREDKNFVKIIRKKPKKNELHVRGIIKPSDDKFERWICGNCGQQLLLHLLPEEGCRVEVNSLLCNKCNYWSVFLTSVFKESKKTTLSRIVPYEHAFVDIGKKRRPLRSKHVRKKK